MKLTAKSSQSCWKEQQEWSWVIATIGCPMCKHACASLGILLQAPFRLAHSPKTAAYQSAVLGRARYRIDTVFGQLTDRCQIKRVWARDLWHLRNRLLRLVLMHTLCFRLNQQEQAPYLPFDRLVA
jgi:hypothetical protein